MKKLNLLRELPCKPCIFIFILLVIISVSSCTASSESPSFISSDGLAPYKQDHFDVYLAETTDWIRNNRAYLTDQHELEVKVNVPYELKPEKAGVRKGILLVHGLGDSPWFLKDIADQLVKRGWLVRAISLPGHGTRPADLLLPEYEDWKEVVDHHAKLLSKKVDEFWMAGFSTGGNLVTSYAMENDHVSGLLVFSPGYYSRSNLLMFAPLLSIFKDWVHKDEEFSIFRYESLSVNAASLYYQSLSELQDHFSEGTFNKPALIAISEHDSVIDSEAVLQLFHKKFTHEKSRFIWYGRPQKINDPRIRFFESRLPEKQISNFSHMSVVFSPENPFYGEHGSQKVFDNGQEDLPIPEKESDLWYSRWGYKEENKYHVRLTWNPYFKELIQEMDSVLSQ